MRICTHLPHEERYQIYALKKAGVKQTEIAALLGPSPSTISRELRRNWPARNRLKHTRQMAEERARTSCTRRRTTERQWQGVAALIRQDWSPKQIADRAEFEETLAISHELIYRFVYADRAARGNLWRCLRCQMPYRFLVSLSWTDTRDHESVTAFGRANVRV